MPDEKTAFERLTEHLRKAQEAAFELGMHLSDGRWALVATQFEKMQRAVIELRTVGVVKRG